MAVWWRKTNKIAVPGCKEIHGCTAAFDYSGLFKNPDWDEAETCIVQPRVEIHNKWETRSQNELCRYHLTILTNVYTPVERLQASCWASPTGYTHEQASAFQAYLVSQSVGGGWWWFILFNHSKFLDLIHVGGLCVNWKVVEKSEIPRVR